MQVVIAGLDRHINVLSSVRLARIWMANQQAYVEEFLQVGTTSDVEPHTGCYASDAAKRSTRTPYCSRMLRLRWCVEQELGHFQDSSGPRAVINWTELHRVERTGPSSGVGGPVNGAAGSPAREGQSDPIMLDMLLNFPASSRQVHLMSLPELSLY